MNAVEKPRYEESAGDVTAFRSVRMDDPNRIEWLKEDHRSYFFEYMPHVDDVAYLHHRVLITIRNISDSRKGVERETVADPSQAELFPSKVEPDDFESNVKWRRTVQIAGEEFLIEKEGEYIFLTHEEWSLSGFGRNLLEAEQMIYDQSRELLNTYMSWDLDKMTPQAVRLRDFILRVAPA